MRREFASVNSLNIGTKLVLMGHHHGALTPISALPKQLH